jgi:uncharacterized protein (DUF1015 family)
MADVQPFAALHYNLDAVGSLDAVTAPPYDVIDAAEREALLARSPFNVVELDLPVAPGENGDPYAHAAEILDDWTLSGILLQDREPSIWGLTQEYTGPDGSQRRRNSILAGVRVTDYGPGLIRPHERTQPGPRQDRLDLTRATRYNLSPIFSLTTRDAWPLVEPATGERPWAEVTEPDGTVNRIWKISDPAVHEAVTAELAEAELLIADGHHRYETARVYRDEIGGPGPHEYTLMALTGLDDPGLTVFPTHRLLSDLGSEGRSSLREGLGRAFSVEEVEPANLDPDGLDGLGRFGYLDADGTALMIRLADPAKLDRLMGETSEAYRTLDAAILEKVVLADVLGMSETDVEAKKGIGYAKTVAAALEAVEDGTADAAFILRATPVEQVREVAGAGETMPPKSTYFFPKLLSGMAFNPLSQVSQDGGT